MTASEIRTFLQKVGKATRPEIALALSLSDTAVRMGLRSLHNRDELVMCGFGDSPKNYRIRQWSLK